MISEISTFPDASQVWVFPSPVKLNEKNKSVVKNYLAPFISSWKAHGKDVLGAYWIDKDYFICIAAHTDVTLPTGCSIDSMIHAIGELEKALKIDLRDRSMVYFVLESGEISKMHFSKINESIQSGLLTPNTQVFQTSINTLDAYRYDWLISAQKSWINRFFLKKVNIS